MTWVVLGSTWSVMVAERGLSTAVVVANYPIVKVELFVKQFVVLEVAIQILGAAAHSSEIAGIQTPKYEMKHLSRQSSERRHDLQAKRREMMGMERLPEKA